jgi:ketosteroid isomerase-like protein
VKRVYTPQLAAVLAVLLLVFVPTAFMQEAEVSAADILLAFNDAVNIRMIDLAMAFVAPDATFHTPGHLQQSTTAILSQIESELGTDVRWVISNLFECNGRVTYDYETRVGERVAQSGGDGVSHIEDGLITFDGVLALEVPLRDPQLVYVAYFRAVNRGNFETAMSYMADDIVVSVPAGIPIGKDAVRAYWEANIAAGITLRIDNLEVRGNRVYTTYTVLQNGTPIDAGDDGLAIIDNGLITFDGFVNDVPQPLDAVGVVEAYYAALNAGDLEGTMGFVADEALFRNPLGEYTGSEAISTHLASVIADGLTFTLTDFRVCDGRVVYDYEVLQNGTPIGSGDDRLTIAQDGKIVFDGTVETEPE